MSGATLNKREQLCVHRVELQMQRKFLRTHEIRDVFSFQRLVEIIPTHQFLFAQLDERKARQHLKNAGHGPQDVRKILERIADAEGNLDAQCRILRKRGKLKNVRRLLIPMDTNKLVRKALKKWLAQWPRAPRRIV